MRIDRRAVVGEIICSGVEYLAAVRSTALSSNFRPNAVLSTAAK
jgi:hypothetical protein